MEASGMAGTSGRAGFLSPMASRVLDPMSPSVSSTPLSGGLAEVDEGSALPGSEGADEHAASNINITGHTIRMAARLRPVVIVLSLAGRPVPTACRSVETEQAQCMTYPPGEGFGKCNEMQESVNPPRKRAGAFGEFGSNPGSPSGPPDEGCRQINTSKFIQGAWREAVQRSPRHVLRGGDIFVGRKPGRLQHRAEARRGKHKGGSTRAGQRKAGSG